MNSIEERLAVLERLSGIPQAEPRKPAPEPEGVRILTEIGNRGFEAPSVDELHHLYSGVLARIPALRPRAAFNEKQERLDSEHFASFSAAFHALSQIDRRETPDEKRGIAHWIDVADDLLSAEGRSRRASAGFMAAVVAHGDILFTPLDSIFSTSLGLVFGSGGRKATSGWRRVLAGEIPTPFISSRESHARANPPHWSPGRVTEIRS
jgi:hypothetical protein